MTTKFFPLVVVVALVVSGSYAGVALAAAPQTVSYYGSPVTTAVPGKPFTMKFRVQNTSGDSYSGIRVIFHMPSQLNVTAVAPSNSSVEDGTVSWVNVPLEPGKSFYPALTLIMDSGTKINTKSSIWVQVTGTDMQETSKNFSVTARSSVTSTTTTLSSADVSALFTSVYGRAATASELKYWLSRRADKPGRIALQGAIAFHKANNIKH